MKEILEAIAATLSWQFHYGREDFLNWVDSPTGLPVDQIHLFVDPVVTETITEATPGGQLRGRRYTGFFMVLRNSDLDEEYDDTAGGDGKYQMYIRPLRDSVELSNTGTFRYEIDCTFRLLVEKWRILEVINQFSENWDGVMVEYQVVDWI